MRYLLLILALQSAVVLADTCCIDEDIAAAFVQHESYSREWPRDFPMELEIVGLEYIGSKRGYQGRYMSVAWKTKSDPQSILDIAGVELVASGWAAMPHEERVTEYLQRGFIPQGGLGVFNHQQFCRERDGTLSLQANETSIGTVLLLIHSPTQAGRDCAMLIATQQMHRGYVSGLVKYLPALALPKSINLSHYMGPGSGGGSDEAHATLTIETQVSAPEMAEHFESQMAEQDWSLETRFQGGSVSGHIWRREVDGLSLSCSVTATDGGDRLRLRMHLEPI